MIMSYMKRKLFSSRQFAFIAGKSTVLQLLYVLDNWTKVLDDGGSIDFAYLDFVKAFDKVPNQRRLYKLKHYCVSEELME